jgi:hypothetical protein
MRWSVHGSAGVLLNEQLTGAHPRPTAEWAHIFANVVAALLVCVDFKKK